MPTDLAHEVDEDFIAYHFVAGMSRAQSEHCLRPSEVLTLYPEHLLPGWRNLTAPDRCVMSVGMRYGMK